MPNLLAHYGVQGLATRIWYRDTEVRWVLLACTIPDFPWILQRALNRLVPWLDFYDVRLYAIAQASFLCSLLLCGAFAAASSRPERLLQVLAVNSALHLLVDACQTKWANGVHLIAPFSWRQMNLGLFWPENGVTHLLTAGGLAYATVALWRRAPTANQRRSWSSLRVGVLGSLVVAYFTVPVAFLGAVEEADNHSVKTLRERNERPGRAVEFDRRPVDLDDDGQWVLKTLAREPVTLVGEQPTRPGRVSVRGVFIDLSTVRATELHEHAPWFREPASYVGLALLLYAWLGPWLSRKNETVAA